MVLASSCVPQSMFRMWPTTQLEALNGGTGWVSKRLAPNPSIERTSYSRLRLLPLAAHVER